MIFSIDGASTSEWEAKQRIDVIFRALGSPHRRSLLNSGVGPFMYRSNWECGCSLDYYIEEGGGGFRWHGCTYHNEATGASLLAPVSCA